MSPEDLENLGKGLLYLKHLKILRIRKSSVGCDHIRQLVKSLISNKTIVELDLSNCIIGDDGAICLAKLMMVHPALTILRLTNNKIQGRGSEGKLNLA